MKISTPSLVSVSTLASTAAVPQGGDVDTSNDHAFINGGPVGASAGNFSFIQLLNPAASGIIVYVDAITLCRITTAGRVLLTQYDVALTNQFTGPRNKRLSGANSIARVRWDIGAGLLGTQFGDMSFPADVPFRWPLDNPWKLAAGQGLLVEPQVVNMGIIAMFEWREY